MNTESQDRAILDSLSASEAGYAIRIASEKVPIVSEALAGSDWTDVAIVASYLLAAVFNRHPGYIGEAMKMAQFFSGLYAESEAALIAANPKMQQLIDEDVVFIVVPEVQKSQQEGIHAAGTRIQ